MRAILLIAVFMLPAGAALSRPPGNVSVFAQREAAPTRPRPRDVASEYVWPMLSLVGALLFAALVIALVQRWFRSTREEEMQSDLALLTEFRRLQDEGHLTEDEFKQVKSKLSKRASRDEPPLDEPIPLADGPVEDEDAEQADDSLKEDESKDA